MSHPLSRIGRTITAGLFALFLGAAQADQIGHPTIGSFQHAIDLYKIKNPTHAIIVLHGGSGNKEDVAISLGMRESADETTGIRWDWLNDHKVLLVAPQGQADSSGVTTWNNYAMNSGQNDEAFLNALVDFIHNKYGTVTKVTLMGHSMGGVMTNRMWCESPDKFDAFVSIAGPASSQFNDPATPCTPGSQPKPYMGIMGTYDVIMQNINDWFGDTWVINPAVTSSFVNDVVIGEFKQQTFRVSALCGVTLKQTAFTSEGNVDTWTKCHDKMILRRVNTAGHTIDSIEGKMGASSTTDIMDAVVNFVPQ